jgi:hypothetical protein
METRRVLEKVIVGAVEGARGASAASTLTAADATPSPYRFIATT